MKDLCSHPKFQNGDVHTGFINENYDSLFPRLQVPDQVLAEATLGIILCEELEAMKKCLKTKDPFSPFALETGLRINHSMKRNFSYLLRNEEFVVDVQYSEPEVYLMRINDLGPWRRVTGSLIKKEKTLELKSEIDGVVRKVIIARVGNEIVLFTRVRHHLTPSISKII